MTNEKTTTISPDNLRLFNRYRVDVRLVRERPDEEPDVYTITLPENERQWCQYSYDYEETVAAAGNTIKRPHYCSIDPSGGPFIALGDNVISLYPSGTARFNVERIYESLETKRWYIQVKDLNIQE